MSTRETQGHLKELYGTEISPALISSVTDSVLKDVQAWQGRALDSIYPIIYLDALHLKMRLDGLVQTRAVYLALGVNLEGRKELLGRWIGEKEGSKFWLSILTELRNRGVRDILIACVDGLTGFPEAITSEFPKTEVQLCIVHMVRNSLRYVSWKERKIVASDLRTIYTASTAESAASALESFAEKWDTRFPNISRSWRDRWEQRHEHHVHSVSQLCQVGIEQLVGKAVLGLRNAHGVLHGSARRRSRGDRLEAQPTKEGLPQPRVQIVVEGPWQTDRTAT